MLINAFRTWLYDRFIESLTDDSGLLPPYNAPCGVLYGLGFTSANTEVVKEEYSTAMTPVPRKIIIADVTPEYNTRDWRATYNITLEIYWLADFSGQPTNLPTPIPPDYTDEADSSANFNMFLNGIGETLLRAMYYLDGNPGDLHAVETTYKVQDDSYFKLCIERIGENISLTPSPVQRHINNVDRIYAAVIKLSWTGHLERGD
jgi:hypothetical protein